MGRGGSRAWIEAPADDVGDAIVAALTAGGIDHLFFTSDSEIPFFQEATAKARARGHNKVPRMITVAHEHASLNAALGFAAVSGRSAVIAAHVDCGTMHFRGAVHTAWRSGLPVVITAAFLPPTAFTGSMKGVRDDGVHSWMQETDDQYGIVRYYKKWDHRLTHQDNPVMVMSRVIQVTRSEPCGPVYLSFLKELTVLPVDGARFPSADQLGIPRAAAPHPDGVRQIAERLVQARHPVVVVERSGRDPDSVPALVALCEMLGLAVVDRSRKAICAFRLGIRCSSLSRPSNTPTSCSYSKPTCRGCQVAIRRLPTPTWCPSGMNRSSCVSRLMSSPPTYGSPPIRCRQFARSPRRRRICSPPTIGPASPSRPRGFMRRRGQQSRHWSRIRSTAPARRRSTR